MLSPEERKEMEGRRQSLYVKVVVEQTDSIRHRLVKKRTHKCNNQVLPACWRKMTNGGHVSNRRTRDVESSEFLIEIIYMPKSLENKPKQKYTELDSNFLWKLLLYRGKGK